MKHLLIAALLNYAVIGLAHMLFVLLLAKRPTLRLALTELLLWPRRTWHGIKAIKRDAGKLDL